MDSVFIYVAFLSFKLFLCSAQVLSLGKCVDLETMRYFELEKFLGTWYEIERFPTWYEEDGACAYKRVQACGRRVQIEHGYIRDGIHYALHVNSTYNPGDEAVFVIQENNIDPVGIPLSVITSDYNNYAIIYGCKNNLQLDMMYLSAWILSRTPTLEPEILDEARRELNAVPFASVAYLEKVEQSEAKCQHHWTAHIQAVNVNDDAIDQ